MNQIAVILVVNEYQSSIFTSMPTPVNRAKIQLVRGSFANISASIGDLSDGELCYAKDQNRLYMVEGTTLTEVEAKTDPTISGDVLTTAKNISNDFILDSDRHMMSIHEVTVDNGVTVTVPDDCVWLVVV